MAHELIRYQPEHRQEAARLLTEFWPDAATAAVHLSWIHERNPYTDHPFIYLVIIDGKAVGMRAFHGARYEVVGSGETFDTVCGTMFVIDESVRGQGLATVIMEGALKDIAANGYRYVFSYGARPIPYMSQLRRGWRLAGEYHIMRPEKKQRAQGFSSRLRSAASQRLPMLRKLWHSTGKQALKQHTNAYAPLDALTPDELGSSTLSVSQEADAPAMAELANATAIPGLIRHIRDLKFFNWRYSNPQMDYRFIYWRDTKLRGFLVLQKKLGSADYVRIADWEAENDEILKSLFNVVLKFGKLSPLSIWSAAMSEDMVSFLRDSGFALTDESRGVAGYSPGFLIKSLGDDGADSSADNNWEVSGRRIDDIANWDLRPIFSDSF